jgi:hypothetical protein
MNRLQVAESNGTPLQVVTTCGLCKHWVKLGRLSLGLPQGAPDVGQCRWGPPQRVLVPTQQGPCEMADYPKVPANYPACGQYGAAE